MSSELYGFASERWFADYSRATDGKTPTTGYGLYKIFRSRRPNMPIIGLGFNPDDHTTPHSPMHAWEYEWEQYRHDKHFQLHA